MVGRGRIFLGFGMAKTIKFGTLSIISHAQSLFFIQITPITFRLGESLRSKQVYLS